MLAKHEILQSYITKRNMHNSRSSQQTRVRVPALHTTPHSKGLIEENTMHYILKQECSEVMQIIAIIWLFLTVYSQYFSKVFFVKVHGWPTII